MQCFSIKKESKIKKKHKEIYYLFAVLSRFYYDCILNKQTNKQIEVKEVKEEKKSSIVQIVCTRV